MTDDDGIDALRKQQEQRANSGPKKELAGSAIEFPIIDPWPEPVDGADLADDVLLAITKHVVMRDHSAFAVALWILFTHVVENSRIAPILFASSPTKQCGKSTLVEVVEALTHRPLVASNISTAAVYHVIEANTPTLLIDEADSFVSLREELRGILNSGHSRKQAYTIRMVGEGANMQARRFATFGPKMLAAIGKLPDTLMDRALIIKLARKRKDEPIAPLGLESEWTFQELARKIARWAADHPDAATGWPDMPAPLFNRDADNWRPLLSIADQLGGRWPGRTSTAAVALSVGEEDKGEAYGERLLADLREMFFSADKLFTKDILSWLNDLEDRPWAEYGRGDRPLSPSGLASILGRFDIHPATIRIGDERRKGYRKEQLEEAWSRYLDLPSAGDGTC